MAIYDATWGEAQCAVKDGMGKGWGEGMGGVVKKYGHKPGTAQ